MAGSQAIDTLNLCAWHNITSLNFIDYAIHIILEQKDKANQSRVADLFTAVSSTVTTLIVLEILAH